MVVMMSNAGRPHTDEAPRQPSSGTVELAALRRELAVQFSGARLTVELVPGSCWYTNVRSEVSRDAWDRLRRPVYRRARWRCEVCGGRGRDHPVECHEVWQYDDLARVQRLVGLIALCPACHGVKHLGRSYLMGHDEEAIAHLRAVNGWTADHADTYVELVFAIWELRSRVSWHLDLRWLAERGIAATIAHQTDSSGVT